MTSAEASRRGRRNRLNGQFAEREVARWLRPWYPDACRAVRSTDPDPGDVDCTSPGLWWSVKNTQVEQINAWMREMDLKRVDRIGLLVVRRKGHASPGEWWCWLPLWHLSELLDGKPADECGVSDVPVRLELRHVMPLLVAANYAAEPRTVAA